MTGATFFTTRYGSTAVYARCIAEKTDLPAFDLNREDADRSAYNFLVLGSPVIYHKLMFHRSARRHRAAICGKPAILFSVSGAGAGPKLDDWIAKNLPGDMIAHLDHVALRGHQNPKNLMRYDRMMLIIGGLKNRDRVAAKEEMYGFDYMDKSSIAPVLERVRRLQASSVPKAQDQDIANETPLCHQAQKV